MSSPDGPDEASPDTAWVLAPFERDVLGDPAEPSGSVQPGAGMSAGCGRSTGGLGDMSSYFRFFGHRQFIPDHELQRATIHDIHDRVTLVAESPGDDRRDRRVLQRSRPPRRRRGRLRRRRRPPPRGHRHRAAGRSGGHRPRRRVPQARRRNSARKPGHAGRVPARRVGAPKLVRRRRRLRAARPDGRRPDAGRRRVRDWRAAVRSLRPLLQPSHVVVFGAGRDPHRLGVGSWPTCASRSTARSASSTRPSASSAGSQPSNASSSSMVSLTSRLSPCRQPPRSTSSKSARRRSSDGRRHLGWVRRDRRRGCSPAGRAAGGGPPSGDADRRTELSRRRVHALRARRHVQQPDLPAGRHRHRLPVRWCRDRHRRRSTTTPGRDLLVRVDGQQGRRQRQRPAAIVGRRPEHERDTAVPRVVR